MQGPHREAHLRAAMVRGDAGAVQELLLHWQQSDDDKRQLPYWQAIHDYRRGALAPAHDHVQAILADPPVPAAALAELARVAHGAGDLTSAGQLFSKATSLEPRVSSHWWLLAYVHAAQEQWLPALEAMRQAYVLDPGNSQILEKLVDLEFDQGMPVDALPVVRRWASARPNDVDAQLRLGVILGRLARHADAVAHYEDAVGRLPASADLWMALGQSLEYLGKHENSSVAYQQASALRPGWVLPLAGLLGLHRQQAEAGWVEQARHALDAGGLPEAEQAILGYELGKWLDGNGRHAEAMAAWDKANAARRRQIGDYMPERLEALVKRTEAAFVSAPHWAQRPGNAGSGEEVVLIVGMPRSGTTLAEQIINAHAAAHGAGELLDLTLLANRLDHAGQAWPEAGAGALPAELLQQWRQQYLQALRARAEGRERVLVDKAPLNFFFVGLAAQLFPGLKLVWCRRDPRDVAVSIYAENFSLDAPFATSWEGIADYMAAEARLMAVWKRVLQVPVFELDYRRLVQAPEQKTRELLAFLGLPWDPACLQFHASAAVVQTPSRWQVRQPVNRRSLGRWRAHAGALVPFIARARALGIPGLDAAD